MTYAFAPNLRRSTENQHIVMAYLQKAGREIIDCTDDRVAQAQGIDFYVSNRAVEFKDCNQIAKTRNVCFEIVSNSRKGTIGACLYSRADFLLYYDIHGYICHVMNLPVLRRTIEESEQRRWPAYKVATDDNYGGIAYASFGLLVSLDFIARYPAIQYSKLDLRAFLKTAA